MICPSMLLLTRLKWLSGGPSLEVQVGLSTTSSRRKDDMLLEVEEEKSDAKGQEVEVGFGVFPQPSVLW